jgi:hypothetical protein
MTPVKKTRAPRKPKVQVEVPVEEVPVKKTRAPRKPKVQVEVPVEEVPVKKTRAPRKPNVSVETPKPAPRFIKESDEPTKQMPSKEEIVTAIEKVISGLQTDKAEKDISFFNKYKHQIYESVVLVLILIYVYFAGAYINSEGVYKQTETPKENVKY